MASFAKACADAALAVEMVSEILSKEAWTSEVDDRSSSSRMNVDESMPSLGGRVISFFVRVDHFPIFFPGDPPHEIEEATFFY